MFISSVAALLRRMQRGQFGEDEKSKKKDVKEKKRKVS
jgi:hypothetical protein